MSPKPSVSVIIPTLNEAKRVVRAVQSAWAAEADQVIVADAGSLDETNQLAQQAKATVVTSQPGRAGQQNAGAAVASGNLLLFLHADNWLAQPAINELRDAARAPGPLAGAFRQRIDARGAVYRMLERGNGWRVRFLRQPYGDQGIFVSSKLFHSVGGFPDVPLMEELLLMRRVRQHVRPVLLKGPIYVDARRWKKNGVFRQTVRNWSLVSRYLCGVSPHRLAAAYANHEDSKP